MKNNTTTTVLIIFILLLSAFVFYSGYRFGVDSVEEYKVDTLYIEGDTITQVVNNPVPYYVKDSVPYEVIIPGDTVWLAIDTIEILRDYLRVRKYDLEKVNDSIGSFLADITVTRNKIDSAVLRFVPVTKVVNVVTSSEQKEKLGFYGNLGTSLNLKTIKVQGFALINQKYLVGASAIHIGNSYGYTIDLGVKF